MKHRSSRQANRIQIAHRIYHVQGHRLSVSEFPRVTQGRPQFLQHRRQKNKPSLQDIRLTNTTRTSSFFSHETWPDLTEKKKKSHACFISKPSSIQSLCTSLPVVSGRVSWLYFVCGGEGSELFPWLYKCTMISIIPQCHQMCRLYFW